MTRPAAVDADSILADLNEEQREAATAVSGPVVILAGAGTGKTRVISHRVAYAVVVGAVDERQTLVVSFTNKAADEMRERLRRLGMHRATASTLHAAAKRQLEHFWPLRHGKPLPDVRPSKLPILTPLVRRLPGGYRYVPARDLADEIEWAKNRRIGPDRYEESARSLGRTPRIPVDVMGRLYADYEAAKRRAGVFDFEDLLEEAIRLYERDGEEVDLVRRRYAWFSVDEYQDTNPLQHALLDVWLGDRRDIAVVGDPNQTIYTFTGATPQYLLDFGRRFPESTRVSLTQNYRSTPQILEIANRLMSSSVGPTLRATHTDGPVPQLERFGSARDELAFVVRGIRDALADGSRPSDVAVLTRTNFQLEPLAAALRAAAVPFHFQGTPFFQSPEVRAALRALRGSPDDGDAVSVAVARWRTIGFDPDAPMPDDPDAVDRREIFETLLSIAREVSAVQQHARIQDLLAEFERQAAVELDVTAEGVTLSTIHGAKGAEWSVVFLPMLEEGSLPIRYAFDSSDALAEERRLLYVAITRAKRRLAITWAATRDTAKGKSGRRSPSRFIAELRPPRQVPSPVPRGKLRPGDRVRHPRHGVGWVRRVEAGHAAVSFDSGRSGNFDLGSLSPAKKGSSSESRRSTTVRHGRTEDPVDGERILLDRLMEWRRDRARQDGVPAYVVAHDAHLRAIAASRPSNEAQLLRLPGVGPAKAERYGEEILAIVASLSTE